MMRKLLTSLVVLFSAVCLSTGGAVAKEYKDMTPEHWAYKNIQQLTDWGVVVGYPDGNYRPDQNVTRGEFSTMVIKALGQANAAVTNPVTFSDMTEKDWFYDMVQRAVMFDLVKGYPDGKFYPYGTVERGHAISVITNALTTEQISESKAREILESQYTDYTQLPPWLIVMAGKAEILGMVVTPPGHEGKLEAERPANRAELASFLVNMIEQAKLNPNEKLREAMRPPTYDGIVIEDTTLQGYIATIPAGAIIPIMLLDSSVSRKDFIGEPYKAKFPKNLITPEHYLLFPEGCMVYGDVQDVKPQRFFIRHGEICLRTCTLDAPHNPGTTFAGIVIDPPAKHGFWKKEFVEKTRIKGAKRYYDKGMVVNVKLLKPIKVDLTNGYIVE